MSHKSIFHFLSLHVLLSVSLYVLHVLQFKHNLAQIDANWFHCFQEDIVEIEFVERQPAPKPEDSLLHDDWVSCLQGCKEW